MLWKFLESCGRSGRLAKLSVSSCLWCSACRGDPVHRIWGPWKRTGQKRHSDRIWSFVGSPTRMHWRIASCHSPSARFWYGGWGVFLRGKKPGPLWVITYNKVTLQAHHFVDKIRFYGNLYLSCWDGCGFVTLKWCFVVLGIAFIACSWIWQMRLAWWAMI